MTDMEQRNQPVRHADLDAAIDAAVERANARQNASWRLMCEKMVAAERERCAKLCESMGPVLCESYGDGAECIATADACADAIRRA